MTLPGPCPRCGPRVSPARRTLWEVNSVSLIAGEVAQALGWQQLDQGPLGVEHGTGREGGLSGPSELGTGGRGRLAEDQIRRLLLLQTQLLHYVHVAINNMVRQCSPSTHGAPKSMDLFSKLDLIQVRPRCRPRLVSSRSLS